MSKEQTATVPVKAPPELIDSMVLRFDHGAFAPAGQELNGIPFGFQTEEERMRHINYLRTCMRQVHEEVVGTGFYKYPDAPASPSPAGGVQGVTVKPLEWEHVAGSIYDADGSGSLYRIVLRGDDWKLARSGEYLGAYYTLEGAQDGAQSDYEQRILSALSSQAQTTGGVG